jgi:hypothetical protein
VSLGDTDPIQVGERLLRYRQLHPDKSFSEVADLIPWDEPELAMRDEDLSTRHAENRRKELTERAESGDRFALALLNGDSLAEEVVD